ncbi:MAG: hypothetical protein HQ530_03425 [Parcubacteria group bacterium]|nr:hypothetical protein [Parcubacteria group bacterium]
MPGERIKVKEVNLEVLEPPYCLRLARGVDSSNCPEDGVCLGFHFAPADLREFFLTTIVDETTPNVKDEKGKLMVCTGTQYGCSVKACPFCVYCHLPYYRNLSVAEMVDLFRAPLFLYSRHHDFRTDKRQLSLKFTDNGEPLENPLLPAVLDQLVGLFGMKGKVLGIKISTVLKNDRRTREAFDNLLRWQRENLSQASIHLQISVIPGARGLMLASETRELVEAWMAVNPHDQVCFAPGLFRGDDEEVFWKFCETLKGMKGKYFFRLSIIKPSSPGQEEMALDEATLTTIYQKIADMEFRINPLPPRYFAFSDHLRVVGTLSHLPDGRFYDPATYRIWKYELGKEDPNTPL